MLRQVAGVNASAGNGRTSSRPADALPPIRECASTDAPIEHVALDTGPL